MTSIPPILIENIKKKNVVLFLGSGFAYGAHHPLNAVPPSGKELGKLISDKFLSGQFQDSQLTYISDLAISQSSLFEVQRFIYDTFRDFHPNQEQIAFTNFLWKAIFTTNYDQILEEAYSRNENSLQEINPVYRNSNEQDIFRNEKTVPYYKLHGCISYINDNNLPLILSTEQYLTHKTNRDRLFTKFKEVANDYTMLFVGYSNQDSNIRAILNELESLKDGRPRSYMVSPNISPIEIAYWAERRITCIVQTAEQFIEELSEKISKEELKLTSAIKESARAIYTKFVVDIENINPTESLIKFLDFESEFIHSAISTQSTLPQAFYKGYFENWDPILKNLDAERVIKDYVLTDILFEEKFNDQTNSYLFSITGFAGSGKSVLLRRLAWETAITFEKLCLFVKKGTPLRAEPIVELYHMVKERIYIFVDDLISNEQGVIFLKSKLEKEGIPITIIGTARTNQLNENKELQTIIDKRYKLNYLNEKEIDHLLNKLKIHKSLGHLEKKNREDQQKELSEISGRVLLVALHEATGGKTFEDIIFDEFNSITDPRAKSLYLTVAILHKLGSYARAGLISRVHNIGFSEFEREFFQPLEYIVFSEKNYTIGDYIYKTRHPLIAEMIFNTVLVSEQDRYDEYIRILNYLDIDYNSDKTAFLALTKAKKLKELFNDPIKVRNLFDAAVSCSPDNAKLIQQKAIYEMIIPGGNHDKAEEYLKEALQLEPNDALIVHSMAENYLKKAEKSRHYIEKNQYIKQSQEMSIQLIRKNPNHPHAHHTILKSKLLQLKDEILIDQDNSLAENTIKDIEKTLELTKQRFPEQEFILDIDAKFREMIENQPEALNLLEKAFNLNNASPYIALRYSKTLENLGRLEEAFKALEKSMSKSPNEKDLSFRYAMLLNRLRNDSLSDVSNVLRRSFTMGDSRYEAHFFYAITLHKLNDLVGAKVIFEKLSRARVNPEYKIKPRTLDSATEEPTFDGVVTKKEFNHGYIQRDAYGDKIFFNKNKNPNWENVIESKKYSFKIMYNYYGPIAVAIL